MEVRRCRTVTTNTGINPG